MSKYKCSVNTEFFELLTIAFIVLKLCNVIKWSWIWVLSPIWITFVILIIILLVIGIVTSIKRTKF